jgi:hypothetical protein
MVADIDPISAGKATLSMEKFFSSNLEPKEAAVVFAPRTDSVYLQFVYQTTTYRQFWDRPSREKFIAALEQYQKDFDAKNLTIKKSKSRQAYGSVKAVVEWGQFSFNINSRGYPEINLGYFFKDNNPYFTVLQREAGDTIFGERESVRITAYFTRAQAAALAAVFDQAYLLSLVDVESEALPSRTEEVPDEYID